MLSTCCSCSRQQRLPLVLPAWQCRSFHAARKTLTSANVVPAVATTLATLSTAPVNVFAALPGRASLSSKASAAPAQAQAHANYVARVKNDKAFSEYTGKGRSPFPYVVVDFSASWCGPCRMMGPIFKLISEECPNALFLKVDIEDCPQAARLFEVTGVPTVVVLDSERKVVKRVVGLDPRTIKKDIKLALNA